jgi:hypothetical protein
MSLYELPSSIIACYIKANLICEYSSCNMYEIAQPAVELRTMDCTADRAMFGPPAWNSVLVFIVSDAQAEENKDTQEHFVYV